MSNLSTTLKAGDIYLTTYGVAVIIKVNENEGGEVESFRAKLWRQPGKSVATSATATLATNCVRFIYVSSNRPVINYFSVQIISLFVLHNDCYFTNTYVHTCRLSNNYQQLQEWQP